MDRRVILAGPANDVVRLLRMWFSIIASKRQRTGIPILPYAVQTGAIFTSASETQFAPAKDSGSAATHPPRPGSILLTSLLLSNLGSSGSKIGRV